jgi:hypothetical protein
MMDLFLLDTSFGIILRTSLIFLLLMVAIEGLVMLLMKYNRAGKAFSDSFVINLASQSISFVFLVSDSAWLYFDNLFLNMVVPFLITLVIEFVLLYLLNRKKPVPRTLVVLTIVNLVSYLLLVVVF